MRSERSQYPSNFNAPRSNRRRRMLPVDVGLSAARQHPHRSPRAESPLHVARMVLPRRSVRRLGGHGHAQPASRDRAQTQSDPPCDPSRRQGSPMRRRGPECHASRPTAANPRRRRQRRARRAGSATGHATTSSYPPTMRRHRAGGRAPEPCAAHRRRPARVRARGHCVGCVRVLALAVAQAPLRRGRTWARAAIVEPVQDGSDRADGCHPARRPRSTGRPPGRDCCYSSNPALRAMQADVASKRQ
jgi:hypothetical protein